MSYCPECGKNIGDVGFCPDCDIENENTINKENDGLLLDIGSSWFSNSINIPNYRFNRWDSFCCSR
ncbi:hypothetical protein [Methanobacterium sp.]|uniref:hypothetical protein n=1 Tax=Methanobacterium sp. TaxID=2164 RepID=UPI003C720927